MSDIIKKLEAKLERDLAAYERAVARQKALAEAVDKTQVELDAALAVQNVGAGDQVRFTHGRGDNRREEVGTVVAVDESAGVRYKVQSGEGFDVKLTVIFQSQVVEVLDNV